MIHKTHNTDSLSCSFPRLLPSISGRGQRHSLASPVQAHRGAREAHIAPQLGLNIAPVLVCEELWVINKEDESGRPDCSLQGESRAVSRVLCFQDGHRELLRNDWLCLCCSHPGRPPQSREPLIKMACKADCHGLLK